MRPTDPEMHCRSGRAVDLFFGLQGESPENGTFPGFGWRLSGIYGRKSANTGLQRLSRIRKARIWQAFLGRKRKFSKNRTAWLGREGSNSKLPKSKRKPLPVGHREIWLDTRDLVRRRWRPFTANTMKTTQLGSTPCRPSEWPVLSRSSRIDLLREWATSGS